MVYVQETTKSAEEAVQALEAAVERHGFGTLHRYDLEQILRSKGFEAPGACHILEICNPAIASEVLRHEMQLNMALPCRVSVYEQGGKTHIGMISPTELLALVSPSAELRKMALGVEQTITAMIDEAV